MPTRYYLKTTQNEAGTSGTPTALGATVDLATTQGTPATLGSGNTKSVSFVLGKRFLVNCAGALGGSFPVSVNMSAVSSAMSWRFCLRRLDSSNVSQEASAYSSTYTNAGTKTATLSLTGPFGAGERLALDIELNKTSGSANQNFTVSINDTASYVDAPAALRLTADSGSFAVTGTAATPKVGYKVAALAGAFAVAALIPAGLNYAQLGAGYDLDYRLAYTDSAGSPATVYSNTITASVLPVVRAASGAFAFTGADASLKYGPVVAADSGTFAVSGTDATLTVGAKSLPAESGSFAITGGDVTFSLGAAYRLDYRLKYTDSAGSPATEYSNTITATVLPVVRAASGAFAVSGTEAALLVGRPVLVAEGTSFDIVGRTADLRPGVATPSAAYQLDYKLVYTDAANAVVESNVITADVMPVLRAASGSFGVSAPPVDLRYTQGRKLIADAGAFSVAGPDVNLIPILQDPPGEFVVTGPDAGLLYGHRLDAESGAFAFTGGDTTSSVLKISAESGAFAITGTDAALKHGYYLWAASTDYSLAVVDATLLYAQYRLVADSGAVTVAGTNSTGLTMRLLRLTSGAVTVTGADVTFARGYVLSAATGAFEVSGTAATFPRDYVLAADSGAFAVSGPDAAMQHSQFRLTADAGTFTVAGANAGLRGGHYLSAQSGAFTVTGSDAGFAASGHFYLYPDAGAFATTGANVTFLYGRVLSAESGAFAVVGSIAALTYGTDSWQDIGGTVPIWTDVTAPSGTFVRVDPTHNVTWGSG